MTITLGYAIYSIRKELMINKFKVNFFKERDGSKPVGQFIKQLDLKMKAKVVSDLSILEEYGNLAQKPLSEELEDGIFELRTVRGSNIIRILYFFDKDKIIIATNGFVKKQQKTPRKEIELAKKRRADYYSRKEEGTYEQ